MGKIGKTGGKVAKHALLIQPIRILIIINSIFLPLLLGILVFIILKYAQNIDTNDEWKEHPSQFEVKMNDLVKVIKSRIQYES